MAPTEPAHAAPALTEPVSTEPASVEPAPGELMPAVIPDGWQVYTNREGFAISYPPSWTAQREPDANDGALRTQALRGPEGEVYLSWGTGFGGACPSGYSDVQVAEGTVQACYTKNADGRESWTQMNRELPATSFSARALTQDGQAASHDLVLQILSTLTFAGAEAAPGLQPPASEVCNGMAQALMQAIMTEVTQAGEPVEITDPVTMATGTACRAMSTGTGLDFAGPDVPMQALAAVLTAGGWEEDIKLQAGGPTGMGTGFRSRDIVCLAAAVWQPDPSANCPQDQPVSACKVTPEQQLYTVTLDCAQAVATPGAVGLPNPASQNCVAQGGTLRIEERGDLGQFGVCYFEDNRQCEEWALLRGECPVGGVKVTGYTTEAARFCAISGGEYDQDGGCAFKNGVKCDAEAFYAGTCSPNGATGG
jgi:putative hemolysin